MNEGRLRLTLGTVPGDVGELLALLAPDERGRAARFRSAATRAAYVATWAGLRILVANELGVPPRDVPIDRGCEHCSHPVHGRPRLPDGEVCFSVARSQGWIAWLLTADAARAGVDLEVVRSFDWAPLAGAVLPPDEVAAIEKDPPALRSRSFLQAWTRLEAIGKAVGCGLFVETVRVRPGPDGWSQISARTAAERRPSRFWTRGATVPAMVVAVAADCSSHLPPALDIRQAEPWADVG